MEEEKTAWRAVLAAEIPKIVAALRSVTIKELGERPGPDGASASDIITAMIRTALVMKEILSADEVDLAVVTPPSFTSPDEASAIMESALENAATRAGEISNETWLSAVHLEGETKDRGHTRGVVVADLLRDLLALAAEIRSIARRREAAQAPENIPEVSTGPDPDDAAASVVEKEE